MPWCDDCSRFWNAPELTPSGACPSCARALAAPNVRSSAAVVHSSAPGGAAQGGGAPSLPQVASSGPESDSAGRAAEVDAGDEVLAAATSKPKGAPWHFKVLVVGVAVYMVYRIYWLIEWLPKHV
ncbi:MAG TPA: hypothetical protein VME46_03600 [Acidimicrobiales bacterium]|nr:hypothetical protein [Acidimicrobiales bacterium]